MYKHSNCNPGCVAHLRMWVEPGLQSGLGSKQDVQTATSMKYWPALFSQEEKTKDVHQQYKKLHNHCTLLGSAVTVNLVSTSWQQLGGMGAASYGKH